MLFFLLPKNAWHASDPKSIPRLRGERKEARTIREEEEEQNKHFIGGVVACKGRRRRGCLFFSVPGRR